MSYRLGLIVNPVAGMGGAVGLKGTDGERYAQALARGAGPVSPRRTAQALAALHDVQLPFELLTAGGAMGATVASEAGIEHQVVFEPAASHTAAVDTVAAAEALARRGIDLLLFAGGDGTARDLLKVIDRRIPVLGIPAGVKMHSAVFAPGSAAAGDIAAAFLQSHCNPGSLVDAEVMDRQDDESSPGLYGTLRVPTSASWSPHPKAGAAGSAMLNGAIERTAEFVRDERLTLIGPGATMQAIKQHLGSSGTLLGVDAFEQGRLVEADLSAERCLALLDERRERPGRIVVGIVGGQGFLFGRGNQQFSPAVIRRVGPGEIVVVAAMEKLTALDGRALYVDTGDDRLDRELAGYISVRTGARRSMQYRVAAPAATPEP